MNDDADAQQVKFVVTRRIVIQASPIISSVTAVSKNYKSFMQHVQALCEHNASVHRFCCEMKTSCISVVIELFIVREGIDRGGQVHGRNERFHPVNATRAHPLTQQTSTTGN